MLVTKLKLYSVFNVDICNLSLLVVNLIISFPFVMNFQHQSFEDLAERLADDVLAHTDRENIDLPVA